jgi:chain length determinant protein tyrosine kinase EpsG
MATPMRSRVLDLEAVSGQRRLGERPGRRWLAAIEGPDRSPEPARRRFSDRPLGEIMVNLGMLSARDRDAVLQRQGRLGVAFGQCCLDLRLIQARDLEQALAWQFGCLDGDPGLAQVGKELAAISEPQGAYGEALRGVVGRLASGWMRGGRNCLAVTSAESGEGRSHLAANLAAGFAQAGWTTLLIDADLRRPSQHRIFDCSQHPGLSRLLCGFVPSDVVRRVPFLNGLSLVTAGPVPPNPSELLGRNELALFLDQAREYYDLVILDTPPGARLADAELVATAAGSALVLVRRNRSRLGRAQGLAARLTANGVQIAGTLMGLR